jgi:hypothetical protein
MFAGISGFTICTYNIWSPLWPEFLTGGSAMDMVLSSMNTDIMKCRSASSDWEVEEEENGGMAGWSGGVRSGEG